MKIEIKILNKEFYRVDKLGGSYHQHPLYATPGSAAVDLVCTEDVTLYPGERKMIPTGIAIWIASSYARSGWNSNTTAIYEGYHTEQFHAAGLILPRSGLGTKGLILANTVGVIDEDYQGELKISAWNSSKNLIEVKAGDRIAQLMFVPVIKAQWKEVEEFSNRTDRGEGGWGSTGG